MKKQEEINNLLEKHFPTKNYGNTIREHILEYTEDVVKLFAIPVVVGQSEQLVCSCGSRLVKTTGGYHCGNAKCSV